MVVLRYKSSDGITFVTTLTMTANFQQCRYYRLGIEKKWGMPIVDVYTKK
jgi:pyruvate/2-oxoacid:ferredoxin oxidoreductase beta subunit